MFNNLDELGEWLRMQPSFQRSLNELKQQPRQNKQVIIIGVDMAAGEDRTVIRCPICIHPIEVTSREAAHEKSTLMAYCERCDANTEITI